MKLKNKSLKCYIGINKDNKILIGIISVGQVTIFYCLRIILKINKVELMEFKYSVVEAHDKLLKKQKAQILNYFQTGFTNAVAESIKKQKIKLISKSYGIREIDFFYFRANVYLC